MFGYCIWGELKPENIYYKINRILSNKCNSQIHNPHITLDYNVNLKNQNILDNYKLNKYVKIGKIYQSNKDNFYSLQQDYINCSDENDIKLYHVSLAYKVNKAFTNYDIYYANTLQIPAIIYPNQINISLWNCDSIYTTKWYKINPPFQSLCLDDNEDK